MCFTMTTLASPTRHFYTIVLFVMIRVIAIKEYGRFTLLDNEKPDLLYELKLYNVFKMCNINTTAHHNYARINNDCYKNNYLKKGILKFAWYESGTSGTGHPKCTPLHDGHEWSWTCESNLSPSEVTPYRNCSVVCKEGYVAIKPVTARCSLNAQDELVWKWFGNQNEPYCHRIPTTGSLTVSVISNPAAITTTTRITVPVETTTINGLADDVVPRKPEKAENTTNNVLIIVIVGSCVGLILFMVVAAVICWKKRRNSYSRSSQIYSQVSSSPQPGNTPLPLHGCYNGNANCMKSSGNSSETSFSSSPVSTSYSNSNDKISVISETGDQLQNGEPDNKLKTNESRDQSQNVKQGNQFKIDEQGACSQIDEPIKKDKQAEVLCQREVENFLSVSEDTGSTHQEDTLSFDENVSEGIPLMDNGLGNFSLSINSLDNDVTTALPSTLIMKRPANDIHNMNDGPVQGKQKICIVVDLPTAIATAPKMGSSIYSSKLSSKNKNNATTKQMKDKVVAESTPCESTANEALEDVCCLLIKDIDDLVFLQNLGYYLDPDENKAKSWYGLTQAVLKLKGEAIKTIRHHSMGKVDDGHFMNTIQYYTAQGKSMSDIVEYFIQEDTMRCDVVEFIKGYHSNCRRCNSLYTKVNTTNVSTNQIREASLQHHLNSISENS